MPIGASRPFTAAVLRPRLARLLAAHDELVLDVAFGTPTDLEARLVAGELEAVAAPRYVERHGTPRDAEALARHRMIVFARDQPMLAIAEAGVGIAVLPDYFVEDGLRRGRLVRAFRPKRPARNPIVLAWRKGAVPSAGIRAVRDALAGG